MLWCWHVEEREVRGIQRAFHRVRPVALLEALRHVTMRRRQHPVFELWNLWFFLSRAKVCPYELAELACRVGLDGDLAVHRRAGRDVRHLDAHAVDVVLPAVVDAADAAFL